MVGIKQSLEQKQKLSPQQILQTTLLQLNLIDLEQRIAQELEDNPVLELKEVEQENTVSESQEDDDIEWDEILNSPEDFNLRTRYERNRENPGLPIKERLNPIDHLITQIHQLDISQDERRISEEIVWNIDDHGYLDTELEIIADRLNEPDEKVEDILKLVQKLYPVGIGARDLQECLKIQLEVQGGNNLALKIVSDHFNDFANRRFERLMEDLQCSQDELNEAIDEISHLNPKPWEGPPTSDAEYIIPDVDIEEVDGEFVVTLSDSNLPDIQISPTYLGMMNLDSNSNLDVKKFIKKKMESAQWFVQAVQQRQITIMKVVKAIIHLQPDFFDGEISSLKPMVLKDVADLIDMDVSTISRVTRGKYVQTPYGIFELKYFFSGGIATEQGEEISTKIVKEELRKVIAGENKRNPFSDDKLAKLMKEKGYSIARRTVAKYREQMKISVARLRRAL